LTAPCGDFLSDLCKSAFVCSSKKYLRTGVLATSVPQAQKFMQCGLRLAMKQSWRVAICGTRAGEKDERS
jgi:hypothetical protein